MDKLTKFFRSLIDNSFFKNSLWVFWGNFTYAISQWGIIIVLAKLGTVEMVGQFTLGLAVTAPVILLTNLQLRNVVATDAKNKYRFVDYFMLRLASGIVALFLILSILFIVDYEYETRFIIFLVGIAKIVESISDLFHGLLQRHERFKTITISKISKGLFTLTILVILLYNSHSIRMGIIGLTIVWFLVLVVYDVPSGLKVINSQTNMPLKHKLQEHTQSSKVSKLKKLLILTLPLGFVEMIASFNVNTPKYFIESEIGITQLGVFSSLAYFMVAGGTAVYAIGQAAMPRLAKHFADKNRYEFFKLFTVLLYFSLFVGLIGIIIATFGGEYLLNIIYGPEYSAHNNTFIAIMIASALNYMATIIWFGIASTWKFIQQIYIFGGSLIVNLSVCYFLVPSLGIIGGAIAFAAAELSRIFISSIILFGIFKQGFHHVEYSTKYNRST